jgi:hypothetical protein
MPLLPATPCFGVQEGPVPDAPPTSAGDRQRVARSELGRFHAELHRAAINLPPSAASRRKEVQAGTLCSGRMQAAAAIFHRPLNNPALDLPFACHGSGLGRAAVSSTDPPCDHGAFNTVLRFRWGMGDPRGTTIASIVIAGDVPGHPRATGAGRVAGTRPAYDGEP